MLRRPPSSVAGVPPTRRPAPAGDAYAIGCYVAYGLLGWASSGLGAALPQMRDDLGGIVAFYPPLPGAALLVIGLTALWWGAGTGRSHRAIVVDNSVALGTAVAVMAVTGVPALSAAGAVAVGIASAGLIRLLPAALTSRYADDPVPVMTRANAWSSLASIAAPLAVGAAIATGLGWRAGLVVMPLVGAGAVVVLVGRRGRHDDRVTVGAAGAGATGAARRTRPERLAAPAGGPWFDAWLILTLSIVVEFAFVYFAATYLREEVGMSRATSAAGAAAFAVGMAGFRFVAGSVPWLTRRRLTDHLATVGAGFTLMWLFPQPWVAVVGITVAGAGTALLYPIGIDRLMRRFPGSIERGAARGALASGFALLSSPLLLAALRALSDVRTAYLSVPVLLAVIALVHRRTERRSVVG